MWRVLAFSIFKSLYTFAGRSLLPSLYFSAILAVTSHRFARKLSLRLYLAEAIASFTVNSCRILPYPSSVTPEVQTPPNPYSSSIDGQLPGMRLFQAPSALFSSVILLLAYSRPSWAASDSAEMVLDSDSPDLRLQNSTFAKRWDACPNGACGEAQTYCCNTNAGSSCSTNKNSVATCIVVAAPTTTPAATLAVTTAQNGYFTYWTSTIVVTDTVTETYTYSSWISLTTQVQVQSCLPDWAGMTTLCGGFCCATDQYCNAGTCTTNAVVYTATGASATAGTRGTSVTGVIVTSTISPTVTTGFGTPAPAASGNATLIPGTTSGGLSGGAIAGIVIGVIAGIILLLFICLICCLGATIDTILAFFGLRNRRRRGRRVVEEEVIERRRRSGRADSRRWYGTEYEARPPRTGTTVTRIEERRRRTDGLGGLARVGAGLGGLALALGIKRRVDQRRRRREDKSDTESSYYDSSYYYSGSGKLNP